MYPTSPIALTEGMGAFARPSAPSCDEDPIALVKDGSSATILTKLK